MATVQPVRNIAPFINKEFVVTSPWWNERVNPVTGETEIHRGLDITTHANDPVYSMLDGYVHSKGTTSTAGNWVIIANNTVGSQYYGYATRYLHLANSVQAPVGTLISKGQQIGIEGSTGQSTAVHLHVEMQDINRFNWQWHFSYTKSDYIDPTVFMGIDNIYLTHWIYDGSPAPVTSKSEKHFPWYLVANRNRMKHQ
jgi:murein DD-endopeptidase MepM/ murein hydrolase activator NlpD